MPIVLSDGNFFGTLCAVDPEPRTLTRQQAELLSILARLVATQIEVDARASELHAVLEAAENGILMTDPSLRIRFVNSRLGRLFGIDLAGSMGQDRLVLLRERFKPTVADPEGFEQRLLHLYEHADESAVDEAEVTGPPRRFLRRYSGPVPGLNGAPLGRIEVYTDLTRERELERLKDDVVAMVSHELRTPLTHIVGFAELLLTGDFPEEETRQFLTAIHSAGNRLMELINEFLDLRRLESGAQQPTPRQTDLRPLLTNAAAAGSDPTHRIRVDVPDDLPPVLADLDWIERMIENLLSNARKYSPAGTEVRLSGRRVGPMVEVCVSDRGLGIPAEALPYLFEKFYRVDSPDRRAIQGTGLGLAICREIVEAHGGRIWAESDGPGRGSCFCFTLPLG